MYKVTFQKTKNPKTDEDCYIIRIDKTNNDERSFMVETLYFQPKQIEASLTKVLKRIEEFINV